MASIHIRAARDDDAAALITLIGSVFAEYPGCVLDVDGEIPELRRIASAFGEWSGAFWVAERDDHVIGSVGFSATAGNGVELRKLYVAQSARRAGLGSQLCHLVESTARERGADFVELWTDTRFTDAHRLYQRRGYLRGSTTRDLHDLSRSVEYYYRKALRA